MREAGAIMCILAVSRTFLLVTAVAAINTPSFDIRAYGAVSPTAGLRPFGRLARPRPSSAAWESIRVLPLTLREYKYIFKLLYAKIVLEGAVKVRRVRHYLIWKVAKTPTWAKEGP